jgi:outer membrane protein TolC
MMSSALHAAVLGLALVTAAPGAVRAEEAEPPPAERFRRPLAELWADSHWDDAASYLQQEAFAEDDAAPTLDEYVDFALRNSAGLRAAHDRWRAADARVALARGLPDPRLSFTEFIEEIQTRTGPQRRRIGVMQAIPGPGKRKLRGEVASQRAEALWWQVEAERLRVVREIELAYHEYSYLGQVIGITSDNLELLKRLEPVVQARTRAGAGQQDVLRLLVEIGKLENELLTLEGFRPALSARLDAALNRREGALHPWPPASEPSIRTVDREGLRARLGELNPELEALRQLVATEVLRVRLARVEARPDFTLGIDYFGTGDALLTGVPGSGDDPLAFTVGVTIPVWRKKYRAAVEEANLSHLGALASLRDKENRLVASLEHALYLLDDAARQVRLYRDSLRPRARQALTVTEAAYRTADATFLDLIDSQRVLLAFDTAYWRACRDHAQRRADLQALTGGATE